VDELTRRALGSGAAQAAPTAPHATPRTGRGKRSGPERFWDARRARIALWLSLGASGVAHFAAMPFELPKSIDVNDYEGEAAIPIDILEQGGDVPQAVEPPPAPQEPKAEDPKEKEGLAQPPRPDAGAPRDAGAPDAPADAPGDAPAEAGPDGAIPLAASEGDAGEAGAGAGDPQALIASAGAIQADVIYVTVVINAIEIRKNPAAAQLGELLRSIPDWDDFMHGTEGLIDPVRDTDWIMISGPSLRDSKSDAVTLHYATSDANVDKAVAIVSSHYPGKGGPYDAGVPGVRSWLAHADFAERVIERPRSRVLVIVPPQRATAVARQLVRARNMPENIMPGVATYLRLVDPHHAMPATIPEEIVELRLKVLPREDGGADIDGVGDCKDDEAASRAAVAVRRTIRERNDGFVSFGTGGLLDHVDVTPEGSKVHLHLTASRAQIAKTLTAVQVLLGYGSAPPPAPSSTPTR
jgi:hypothetical protein